MKTELTSEQKLFILDLLKLNKSERMYSEETVINIIKQVLKFTQPKPTDEEIEKCCDCKMNFPNSQTYFNWDTGARRCWTCQVAYLENIIKQKTANGI